MKNDVPEIAVRKVQRARCEFGGPFLIGVRSN